MDKTHGWYTVRVYCDFHDTMVDEEVLAENDQDCFRIAEEQHNEACHGVIPCNSEAFSFEVGRCRAVTFKGWISEVSND
jgi:hypothetical protein